MDSDDEVVTVETGDGKQFQVLRSILEMSATLKTLLEDAGTENVVPLPNIEAAAYKKVVEWCKWHKENDVPAVPVDPAVPAKKVPLCEWDLDFLKSMDNAMLFNVILGANYLDIAELLTVGCKGIALQIKGKTPEEIRKIFNITNDFTPEEEERIRKENEWVEQDAAEPVPVE